MKQITEEEVIRNYIKRIKGYLKEYPMRDINVLRDILRDGHLHGLLHIYAGLEDIVSEMIRKHDYPE